MGRIYNDPPTDVISDALQLLKRDHRIIRALFVEFELAAPQQVDPLARRICKMIRVHTQIEAEVFYPAVRAALGIDALIDGAESDHLEALRLVARIESVTSDSDTFDPAVKALMQIVLAHMAEEESRLFAALKDSQLDLVALGLVLIERRDVLMRVLGLHEDDEVPMVQQLTNPEHAARPPTKN